MSSRNHLPTAIHTIHWNDDGAVRRLAQRRQSRKESPHPKPQSRPRHRHCRNSPSSGGTYFTSRNTPRLGDMSPWLLDPIYLSSSSASPSTNFSSPSPGSHSTFETAADQDSPKSGWPTAEPRRHPQCAAKPHTNYHDTDGFDRFRDEMMLIMDFLGISDGELAALVGPKNTDMT